MLLCQSTLLAAVKPMAGGRKMVKRTVLLGTLLGASLLTRQAAVGLALAVLIDLGASRRWAQAGAVAAIAGLSASPWIAWVAWLGPAAQTQARLLVQPEWSLGERLVRPAIFYCQRLPDQIVGPFVEVATAAQHAPALALLANVCALLATSTIVVGWLLLIKNPRRRLAGLFPLCSLGILVLWPYTEAGRLLIPLIPCILVGAMAGLQSVFGKLEPIIPQGLRPVRRRSAWTLVASACFILGISLPYSLYASALGRTRLLEASHRDFDAGCEWIVAHAHRPGPLLSRHPGEVFWRTRRQGLEVSTSERPGEPDADEDAINRAIDRYRVAYLVIDIGRYSQAPPSPLARFVAQNPRRVREAWRSSIEEPTVVIYEVIPEHPDLGPSHR
jgi:hypothetical protein